MLLWLFGSPRLNMDRAVLVKAGTGMLDEDYVGLVEKKVICRYDYTVTNRWLVMTLELNQLDPEGEGFGPDNESIDGQITSGVLITSCILTCQISFRSRLNAPIAVRRSGTTKLFYSLLLAARTAGKQKKSRMKCQDSRDHQTSLAQCKRPRNSREISKSNWNATSWVMVKVKIRRERTQLKEATFFPNLHRQ